MLFLPLALEDDLRAQVRPPGNDHQAGDAVEGRRHPVRIELVAHHGHLPALDAHPAAGHHQGKRQGLGRAVEVGQPQLPGKGTHPLFRAVGDDGKPHTGCFHLSQPPGHFVGQVLAAVGRERVINIQHQRPDALGGQPFRGDVGNILEDIFGGNKHP